MALKQQRVDFAFVSITSEEMEIVIEKEMLQNRIPFAPLEWTPSPLVQSNVHLLAPLPPLALGLKNQHSCSSYIYPHLELRKFNISFAPS